MKKNKKKIPRIRKRVPPGSAPGILEVDIHSAKPSAIEVITYSPNHASKHAVKNLSEIPELLINKNLIVWVNVIGLSDISSLLAIGKLFGLHNLALEDVINTHQRPKFELFADHVFVVLRVPKLGGSHESEQLSLFVGERYVITFQEKSGDSLSPVRNRILQNNGLFRQHTASYLAYAVIDAVVDNFFPVLENFADRLDQIEENLLKFQSRDIIHGVHDIKSELLMLRRYIWSHRDLISSLIREIPKPFSQEVLVYLRDCYDHTLQQLDLLETYRDVCTSLMDLTFSTENYKSNEIMKVLTIVASIFIPLTFITGLYGMNFNTETSPWNMPELNWYLGYPFVLSLMLVIAVSLLLYFRRKNWF